MQAFTDGADCASRDLLDGKIPSDLALLQDTEIRQYAEQYATDQVNFLWLMKQWNEAVKRKTASGVLMLSA